jgi:hypothetical protein
MNQTYVNHQEAYEWEGSYAYSSIVGGFLHVQVGIISLQSLRSRHNIPPPSLGGKLMDISYPTNFLLHALITRRENVAYLSKPLVLKLKAGGPNLTNLGGVLSPGITVNRNSDVQGVSLCLIVNVMEGGQFGKARDDQASRSGSLVA